MASYRLEISRSAEKQLGRLPGDDKRKIAAAILSLAEDPRPRGARKLSGYADVYRIRIDRYRVLYSVSDKEVVVIVLKLGHRKDVYRD